MSTRILLISGSVREGSTNVAALRTAAATAGAGVETERYADAASLPHFNPDDDREGEPVDSTVALLRERVAASDALLICTPEYAGALPGALKNLLEWTVGDAGTHRKPVAWINAAGPAAPAGGADAHASLRKVLGYVGAEIVEAACVRVPVTRDLVDSADGTIRRGPARESIRRALAVLVGHVSDDGRVTASPIADRPDGRTKDPAGGVKALNEAALAFRALHVPGHPLLVANPWDVGSARLLAALGFDALATTSSGHAATLGRLDGEVSREEALAHASQLVAAVEVPVSADLENGFGDAPEAVGQLVADAAAIGLAGGSIEDFSGDERSPIYRMEHAVARIEAAAAAAQRTGFVLTARAENHVHGIDDLEDTIARLIAYESAGADVLYAPGLTRLEDIRRVAACVERPLNVLVRPGGLTVPELAEAGVSRISVGGAFSEVSFDAVARAARELLTEGTFGFLAQAERGGRELGNALRGPSSG